MISLWFHWLQRDTKASGLFVSWYTSWSDLSFGSEFMAYKRARLQNFRDRGNLNSLTGKRHYYSTMNIFKISFFQLSDRFIMRLTIIIAFIGLAAGSNCPVVQNGCSVPRHLPKPWINTMTPSCNKHDVCYYCVSNFYLNG